MAPEQVRAEACDERTDIYAVGVTLFEMLTGRLPHEADTMIGPLQEEAHASRPTRPSTFTDDIDPLLEDIIMRALEADPERRHRTAAEMRTELVEALLALPPGAIRAETNTVSIWPEGRRALARRTSRGCASFASSSPARSRARISSNPPMLSSLMKICGTVRRPVALTSHARFS